MQLYLTPMFLDHTAHLSCRGCSAGLIWPVFTCHQEYNTGVCLAGQDTETVRFHPALGCAAVPGTASRLELRRKQQSETPQSWCRPRALSWLP